MGWWVERSGGERRQTGPNAARERAIRDEIVHALAAREEPTAAANLIGWCVCFGAALALPFTNALLAPLALRIVAISTTRAAGKRLRACLAAGHPYDRALRWMGASLTFAGVTWAAMLWPILAYWQGRTPALAILCVITVAFGLICALLGPMPRYLALFVAAFAGTTALGVAMMPHPVDPWVLVSIGAMTGGSVTFSLGTAQQGRVLAAALIENRELGEELTSALAHAEYLASHDPLTGLLNRRMLFDEAGPVPDHAGHDRQVLAIDLDHFKIVNDRFGHDVGDRVLIAVAGTVNELLRQLPGGPHFAMRLGGEEFMVLLAGIDAQTARAAADALHRRIAEVAPGLIDGGDAPAGLVTSASLGMAPCPADTPLATAMGLADALLYAAKQAGRNRVFQQAA